MAFAVANSVAVSPEGILPTYGWLGPRISFSRDSDDDAKPPPAVAVLSTPEKSTAGKDYVDFEFRLDDPVAMLPADELFADGKLLPLKPAAVEAARPAAEPDDAALVEIPTPEPMKPRRVAEVLEPDPQVFSPKAPTCSSRWRELLGLKKSACTKPGLQKAAAAAAPNNPGSRSLKYILHRNTRSGGAESLPSLPLLRDSDPESVSISSSRLSLSSSSSSSGPEHEDLPRLSLDFDQLSMAPITLIRNPPPIRLVRPCPDPNPGARGCRSPVPRSIDGITVAPPTRGLSVDSPRMNSSGKIIFQGLERSSSSPGSFNGGPKQRLRGMDRSYSSNVPVTPVLNVPMCSLRGSAKSASVFGFGQLFSPQKKERDGPAHPHGSSLARAGSKMRAERGSTPRLRESIILSEKLKGEKITKTSSNGCKMLVTDHLFPPF